MEITQTYETTIMDVRGKIGFSAFVIPARSSALHTDQETFDSGMVRTVAELLGAEVLQNGPTYPSQIHDQIYSILYGQYKDTSNVFELSMYVAFSPIIPFENSPLSAESLASIATSSVKGGTVAIGVTLGYLSAGGTPLLLVTVPAGIVLCGAAISFSKWLEENRDVIWTKLLRMRPADKSQAVERSKKRLRKQD